MSSLGFQLDEYVPVSLRDVSEFPGASVLVYSCCYNKVL